MKVLRALTSPQAVCLYGNAHSYAKRKTTSIMWFYAKSRQAANDQDQVDDLLRELGQARFSARPPRATQIAAA